MIKQIAAMMAATAVISVAAPAPAYAAQKIMLEVSHSQLLRVTNSQIIRIAIANPAIADVAVFDKENVSVIGKASGSTTLMIWTADGMRQDFTIIVTNVDEATAESIKEAMHLPDVEVEVVGTEKRKILLTGFVEDQNEMELAESVAALYVEGEWKEEADFTASNSSVSDTASSGITYKRRVHPHIINKIQLRNPLQVNLAIMVLDITSDDAENYGIKYGNPATIGAAATLDRERVTINSSGDASTVKIGETRFGSTESITLGSPGVFYGGMSWQGITGKLFSGIDGMIQATVTNGKGKVLSRPNITTLSGKEAEILIGGELPIPSSDKNGNVQVSWREYGIKMHIRPTVDTKGKITTVINSEISSLDPSNTISTTAGDIPALTSRKVSTMVDIMDGQTMAIGGLLNNIDKKTITKIPILGNLPIIGEFFKHTSNSKDKRELVILITPTLIHRDDSSKVKVSSNMEKVMNETKKEWSQRKTYDTNNIPDPNGGSKSKR